MTRLDTGNGEARGGDLLVAALVGVIVFALQLPFRLKFVSLMDEGGILQFADDILHGRTLYRDVVVYAFPGIFYLTAAAFAVAGTTVGTARSLAALLFAIASAAVYLLARWSHGRRGALAIVLLFVCYRVWAFPHWHMLSYSSLAVTLVLVATWFVGEALTAGRLVPVAVAGALAAAAVLGRQDVGAAAAAALGTALVFHPPAARARSVGAFAAGFALVLGSAALAIWWSGFALDLVRETILAPLWGVVHFSYLGRPALWPLWRQDAALRENAFSYFPPVFFDRYWPAISESALYRQTAVIDAALKLVYHLPWIVLLLAALVTLARWRRGAGGDLASRRRLLLVLLACAFLAAFNRPHDWVHLLVLDPPTLLLAAALVGPLLRRRAVRVLGWLAVGLAGVASARLAVDFAHLHATPIPSRRGTLYALPAQARALTELIEALEKAPAGAPLAALPYHPLLNFLSGRAGATRYYLVWPIDRNARRDEDVIAELARRPDALVVYSPTEFPHFPRFRQYAAVLFGYLVDRFTVDRAFGGGPGGFSFLLLRQAPPAPGRSLLGPALADAQVTVDPHGGLPREIVGPKREQLVAEALWPVRRVLRVSTVPEGAVAVAWRMTPAAGDGLATSYGVNPERWSDPFAPPVHFAVSVREAGSAERGVMAAEVDAARRPEDCRWREVSVDLSAWAGRPIDVVLRVTGPAQAKPEPELAGWGDPRVIRAAQE